jgi:hypothetical protein
MQQSIGKHFESTEIQDISNNYNTILSTPTTATSTSKNSSRERPSPLEHKKYDFYKPMGWTLEVSFLFKFTHQISYIFF